LAFACTRKVGEQIGSKKNFYFPARRGIIALPANFPRLSDQPSVLSVRRMTSEAPTITQLLVEWSHGNQQALDRLTPLVYDELRRMARTYLRRERPDHTLQATALVHEAYLRLVDQHSVSWQNRAHFFGIASQMMRRILVNHALARATDKRDGGQKLSLNEVIDFAPQDEVDLIALDEALHELERLDPQQTRIVELRFFGGLSIEETAEALGVSPATVKRDWSTARLWLRRKLAN
jgi:RNA polymerase sigma factor (TIGR02999 family)